jgi:hypothetical protein
MYDDWFLCPPLTHRRRWRRRLSTPMCHLTHPHTSHFWAEPQTQSRDKNHLGVARYSRGQTRTTNSYAILPISLIVSVMARIEA